MEITIPYKPKPKQLQFHQSNVGECFFGGAKGPGKSRAMVEDALAYALQFKGSDPHLFRETYDMLNDTLIKEFKDNTPEELYEFNEQRHEARIRNGSVIKFRYCSCYADAMDYDGRSIPYLGIDELTKHDERTAQQLMSCNRCAKGWPVLFRATGNPGGIGHAWVKNRYVTGTDYGKRTYVDPVTENTIQFIPANVYDGVLTEKDPQYVKRLENLPENRRKALLYGDWDIFEGQYFSNFGIHLEERPYKIPPHILAGAAFGAMDYGPGLMGISSFSFYYLDPEGVVHKLFNWWRTGLTASEQAADLYDYVTSFFYTSGVKPKKIWCDTNMFNRARLEEDEKAPVDYFKEKFGGGTEFLPANKNRINGAQVVLDYFQPDPLTGKTKFKYWPEFNRTFEKNIKLMIHDENNPGDVLKCDIDHWYDECRYGLVGLGGVTTSEAISSAYKHNEDINDIIMDMQRAGRIGVTGI